MTVREEIVKELDGLLTEWLRAAEMRQGCTNHSYYAEILRKQILSHPKIHIEADDQTVELLNEEEVYQAVYGEKYTETMPEEIYKYLPNGWEKLLKCFASKMIKGDGKTKWMKVKIQGDS